MSDTITRPAFTRPAFERGCGNVFRDLGFERPDDELAKATLIVHLRELVAARRLRQIDAARVLGISQSKVSVLLRGHSEGFSTERLMRLLTRLDQDIDIVVRPSRSKKRPAHIRVVRARAGAGAR
jgi:predicted XRE-type DNA-binding protein